MSDGLYVFKTSNLVPGLSENNKTIMGPYVPEPTVPGPGQEEHQEQLG